MILVVGSRNQLQFQPAARDRRGAGQAVLSDRRRGRAAAGMVRGHGVGGRDRRRLGAGNAGAGRAGRAAPVRRDRGLDPGRRGGGRAVPLPRRTGRRMRRIIDAMAVPLNQALRVGAYVVKQHLIGPQALSAGADAGAAVPLQPGLRRLRQDRLSGRNPEPAPVGRRVHGGDRRVRRAGRGDRRRRAAAASATSRRSSRAPSRARSSSSSAPTRCCWKRRSTSSSRASGSPGRSISTASARSTTSRCARTASMTARWRRSRQVQGRGFRTIINCTLFDGAEPDAGRQLLRRRDGDGRRRHHGLARLCL